jgi:sugar lactone lactonase YvrE
MRRFIFFLTPVAMAAAMMIASCTPNAVSVVNLVQVTTLAGDNTGYTNGLNTGTSFKQPSGVATDAAGNVYVADAGNNLIREISPSGVVTTLAGGGNTPFSPNGTGTAASFNFPTGVAVDAAGNVYVADAGNNLIRKISPSRVVTTLAGGSHNPISPDGTGTAASFSNPTGVAVDAAGNVYVADADNNLIRKISPSGVVTTLAGILNSNSGGLALNLYNPTGVAVDAAGNVYAAEQGNDLIRKISPSGVMTILAGAGNCCSGSVNGVGMAARFASPEGVAVDIAGNVYVADTYNNLVRKISPSGVVTTLAGNGAVGSVNGKGFDASFNYPTGVAVDAEGNVYVADTYNNLIRKISKQ